MIKMLEFMLLVEMFKLVGKIVLYVGTVVAVLLILFLMFVFYFICVSEDNCTACPGALDGTCNRCKIHKNKMKRERKDAKKKQKLNEGGEK